MAKTTTVFLGLIMVAMGLSAAPGDGAEAAATAAKRPHWTIVHAGTLLAVPGQAPKSRQSLVIKDGTIVAVRDGFITPAEIGRESGAQAANVIDLGNRFVLPGFIDLHVHFTFQAGSGSKLDRVTDSDADVAFTAAMYAQRTLAAGFTTVRDLGSQGRAVFALRDAIAAGKLAGPRIVAAGQTIAATGGHGDVHGFREDILALYKSSAICDGADDCRRAVRAQVKRGSDVIKVTATGGVLSETAAGTGQQMTDQELKVIAETAHALGRKVTAHAHEAVGIEAALRAGFDSIEHAMWADADTMKLFVETGAWLIPTIYPITAVGDTPEKMKKGPFKDMPPAIMAKLLRLGHQPMTMTKLAYEMGVKIALGTDSGVSPHGEQGNEFIEYVNIGMTPMEAIVAGTVSAAEVLDRSDQLGTLEPGKAADVVAVAGNPLEDISELVRVKFVMHAGSVFKNQP